MTEAVTRDTERAKYEACYALPNYKLQGARLQRVSQDVDSIPTGSTYLDVGCGRGEMVMRARRRSIPARGVELVPSLCDGRTIVEGVVTDLPFDDNEFDYVSCYDMLEHLPTDQVDRALDELFRVCGKRLFLTTNNKRSTYEGMELHLTRKPREWWNQKIIERTNGGLIAQDSYGNNEWHWRVDL